MTSYLACPDEDSPVRRFDPATAEPVEVLLAMMRMDIQAHHPCSLAYFSLFERWMRSKELRPEQRLPPAWLQLQFQCFCALHTQELIERMNLEIQEPGHMDGISLRSGWRQLATLWGALLQHLIGRGEPFRSLARLMRFVLRGVLALVGLSVAFTGSATLAAALAHWLYP